jgi:hypothetical protein
VPWIGGSLDDILCEQYERTVGHDNCVRFEGITLQIPADRHRCHYVKAKVGVHCYPNGSLAVFHGPRKLADAMGRSGKVAMGSTLPISPDFKKRTILFVLTTLCPRHLPFYVIKILGG